MKISERVEYATKPQPLTCSPDDKVIDAVVRMTQKNGTPKMPKWAIS